MKNEIKDIIIATSMGELEKEAVIMSLQNLRSVSHSLSLPTDEEIKQKAFEFSYMFSDDEDSKRCDAV